MESIANALIQECRVRTDVITSVSRSQIECVFVLLTTTHIQLMALSRTMATTAAHEFSPICAIVGGLLGQDILKVLQGKDAPIANFLTFDGFIGGATVCSLAMQ